MKTEFKIVNQYGEAKVQVHARLLHNPVSELASHLIDKWGMVVGIPDGEDSSGRMKPRLLTPEEVVMRACDTAELAFSEFQRRNWITVMPPLSDLPGLAEAPRERTPTSR